MMPAPLVALLLMMVACAPAAPPDAQAPQAPARGEPAQPEPRAPLAPDAAAEALMAPGVSLALARHRARVVSDPAYHLRFDVRDRDLARGAVELSFDLLDADAELILDFRGAALENLRVNGEPAPDAELRAGHIRIPAARLSPGRNELSADFAAPIAASGASLIRVEEGDDRFLYTLLVPSDAHGLFPSFDQPDLKGRFTLSVVAPEGWTVAANGALIEREALAGEGAGEGAGGVLWRFGETEPISTYLVAFAAGPWAAVETGPVTTYLRPSRLEDADVDTIAGLNRSALAWLEEYFAHPYPFAKLDILLAPAFPFGGMEHVGLIYYNESRFIFREEPTLSQRLGRRGTIYHEIAHQWFGDLVTMRWFDDLWLKEGFATLMASKVQEALDPGTGAWKTFHLRNKPSAYGIDATRGTTPVWQELETLELAKSVYGPIVYDKAPSILRQLEYLVGEEAFRDGVRLFLRRHAYANADWRELLAAIEEASGVPLEAFGRHHILRAGMPRIETELRIADGRVAELALVQRPVRELPGDPGGWWPGRVRVRLGYAGREDLLIPVTFDGERTVVPMAVGRPAPDYVYPNDGDFGYGLFVLDARSARHLLGRAEHIEDDLLRTMVWGSLWDLVAEGGLHPARFLERALEGLDAEDDEQIAGLLLSRALTALDRFLPDPDRERLQPVVERALLARAADGELPYGMRKSALDAYLDVARSGEARAVLLEFLEERRAFDGAPLEQPSRWRAARTLIALGHPRPDSLTPAELRRDDSAEAEREAFVSGAAIPTAGSKANYFARFLDDPDLNEEWATASLGAFLHPTHRDLAMPYIRPALERLEWIRENRRIFFLPGWVNGFVGAYADREALAVVDRFLEESPELPADLRRRVLHPRDRLEAAVAARERYR